MAGEVYRIEKVFRFLNKRKFLYLLFHQHNGSDLNNDIYSSHSNFINENAISDFVMLFTDFFAGRESAGRPWAEYNHETCGQNILFIYFAADVGEGYGGERVQRPKPRVREEKRRNHSYTHD